MTIVLRPSTDFSGNGRLQGTAIAYWDGGDHAGRPAGWESRGDWSSIDFCKKSAKSLCEFLEFAEPDRDPESIAKALIWQFRLVARQETDTVLNSTEPMKLTPPDPDRPTIKVRNVRLRDLSDQSYGLILTANRPQPRFFNRSAALVEIVQVEGAGVRVSPVNKTRLRGHLDRMANWAQFDQSGAERPTLPPTWLCEDMLEHIDTLIPSLVAVTRAPYCTKDGEIILEPGYNPGTGLYLDMDNLAVPSVPTRPTAENVSEAVALINDDLLVDFPFVSDADHTHAVAALLTPVVRQMFDGPTPLFVMESPAPGTGKGLLADVLSIVSTGELPMGMTPPVQDDEWRKQITSMLMQSPSIVSIDNLNHELDSASLARLLTRTVWSDRSLGTNTTVSVPNRTTWMLTANNAAFSFEIARRTVRCRMDAKVELPSSRTKFKHKLPDWVYANRAQLMWACFVLVRAWIAADRPPPGATKGSFERWAEVVGGVLECAGYAGFLGNETDVYEKSVRHLHELVPFIDVWWEKYAESRLTTDKLFALTVSEDLMLEVRSGKSDRGAKLMMARQLSQLRDRVIGGHVIRCDGTGRRGMLMWHLEPVAEGLAAPAEAPATAPAPGLIETGGETVEEIHW